MADAIDAARAGLSPAPRLPALRRGLTGQPAILVATLALIGLWAQSRNPAFADYENLITILRAAVTTFLIGCAATLVFTGGGLDLSVGGVFALGSICAGKLMTDGVPWPLAMLAGLAAGAAVGLVNGALVLLAKVPPIIATLSTLYSVTGLAILLSGGAPVAPLPGGFASVGQSELAGVPLLVLYAIVIGVAFHLILAHTRFGYDLKALGGNARAATANGVGVRRVTTTIYVVSGVAAALAGILYAARTGTADAQAGGTDITLNVVAAVLIGGTSLFGGVGSILGTALGALLFATIGNALTVADVDPIYQNIVLGAILATAVAADSWRRSRAFRLGTSYG